jgi:hypothetical protein
MKSGELNPEMEMIDRHLAFWRSDSIDRPLVGLFLQEYIVEDIYRIAGEGDTVTPEMVKPDLFFDLFAERHIALEEHKQDMFRPVEPLNFMPWLEGILGMDLLVHGQTVWAEPLLAKHKSIESFQPGWCDAWVEVTLAFVRDLVERFHPQIPVSGPFLRGPADVVAAMIGTERFCLELVDHPGEIERLLHIAASAWSEVYSEVIKIIPPWRGGYIPGARWIFAPGECVYFSEDVTVLLSPAMYKEIFLSVNQSMAAHFPFGFIHRHSTSIHHLDLLLEMPPGWALEVTMDPMGPPVSGVLPVLQKIQAARRPLILFGINKPEQLRELMHGLAPEGLCLMPQANTATEAKQLLAEIMGEEAGSP